MKIKIAALSFIFLLAIGALALFFYDGIETDTNAALAQVQPVSEQPYIQPVSQITYIPIRDFNVPEPLLSARAAIAYDVRSGRTLFSKNEDAQLPIASITKVMTAVIVLENLDLEEVYTIAVEDLNLDGFGADFFNREKLSGRDLLKAMLIESSNDAASVFLSAGHESGIDLIKLMNEKARLLEMSNTHYNDPAGLDDNNTYSSVNDQIELFKYVTMNHAEIWEILSTQSTDIFSVDGRIKHTLINTNRLLGTIKGFVGGKTGMTDGAQGTMSAVINVNSEGDSFIVIVLGTKDRFKEVGDMINWVLVAHTW